MNVYMNRGGEWLRLGHARVPDYCGPMLTVPLYEHGALRDEEYAIGSVAHLPQSSLLPVVERAVLLTDGQRPDFLPGWTRLDG